MANVKEASAGAKKKPEPADSNSLYEKHVTIHPKSVKGRFRTIKTTLLFVLLGLYYIAPWLRWDRGADAPDQAILLDMTGARAYFFSIEIWPQEVYYLTGLLILAAIGLFLATALLGRVWCGFACPQTVWTDLYVWVEAWFEGDRNARIKLEKQPWTLNKIGRKLGKHVVWLLIAFVTGGAFVLYFNDAPALMSTFFIGEAGTGVYTFAIMFTATTYILAGWGREQVCIYMCPWPRIQGAMLDEDSMIVTYEEWRGEPRGYGKKKIVTVDGQQPERGHCTDCSLCVQVCPTGTDIRLGSQMSCIGCALCIDACDTVMDKVGLPRGLITYDSNANLNARQHGTKPQTKIIRPRTVVYAVLLALVSVVMAYTLSNRSTMEVNILHERSPLFIQLSDGSIKNGYTFKILNMVREPHDYVLKAAGIAGTKLEVVGNDAAAGAEVTLSVPSDSVGTFQVFVSAPRDKLDGKSTPLTFILTDKASGRVKEHDTVFAGPNR